MFRRFKEENEKGFTLIELLIVMALLGVLVAVMLPKYQDLTPEVTVFTELTSMIYYYLLRWKHLNRITTFDDGFEDSSKPAGEFMNSPETLLETINKYSHKPLEDHESRF